MHGLVEVSHFYTFSHLLCKMTLICIACGREKKGVHSQFKPFLLLHTAIVVSLISPPRSFPAGPKQSVGLARGNNKIPRDIGTAARALAMMISISVGNELATRASQRKPAGEPTGWPHTSHVQPQRLCAYITMHMHINKETGSRCCRTT
jgi:hypothetical protein